MKKLDRKSQRGHGAPCAIARMGAVALLALSIWGCGGSAAEDGVATTSQLEGTWLMGWAGGLRHYSWIRFKNGSPGKIQINDGDELQSNEPYWHCNGAGSWSAWSNMVELVLPSPCEPETVTFLFPAQPSGLPGSSLRLTAQSDGPNFVVEAFRFGDSQCDGAMVSCTSPFM